MKRINKIRPIILHSILENSKDLPKNEGFFIIGIDEGDGSGVVIREGYFNIIDKTWYTQLAVGDAAMPSPYDDPASFEWHLNKRAEGTVIFWARYPSSDNIYIEE